MRYTVRPISDRSAFTGRHERSRFESTWSSTLALLGREVDQLRGRDVVLEVDVTESMIRLDGGLYANARPTTPAVRIAFESKHGPLVYATDRFTTWQDNVRAVALGLEALRKVDRYGITKRGEQYTGWKAIGAGPATAMGTSSHMTSDEAWSIIGSYQSRPITDFMAFASPADMQAAYKRARAANHPDRRGGDRTMWDQVEQAARVLGVLS